MQNTAESNLSDATGVSRRTFLTLASVGVASILILPRRGYAAEAQSKRSIVDSAGRTAQLNSAIQHVLPTGPYAQMLMESLYPERLGAIALPVKPSDKSDYESAGLQRMTQLPDSTHVIDGLKTRNGASTLSNSSDFISNCIVLDVGFPSESLQSKLSSVEEETGIPCFFFDISFGMLADTYRALGEALGCEARAEALASYIEGSLLLARSTVGSANEICRIFYAPRENGTMLKGDIRVQIDLISYLGGTPIVSPYNFDSNSIEFDDSQVRGADVIIFDDTNVLPSLVSQQGEAFEIWGNVPAVSNKSYLVSPALLHSWFGSALFAQSIGALWLADNLWPENQTFSIRSKALEFYELFYGITEAEINVDDVLGVYDKGGEDDAAQQ